MTELDYLVGVIVNEMDTLLPRCITETLEFWVQRLLI